MHAFGKAEVDTWIGRLTSALVIFSRGCHNLDNISNDTRAAPGVRKFTNTFGMGADVAQSQLLPLDGKSWSDITSRLLTSAYHTVSALLLGFHGFLSTMGTSRTSVVTNGMEFVRSFY